MYVSPVPEYILGVDVLQELNLQTSAGEFHLCVQVVKTVVRGHTHHSPQKVPAPRCIVNVKQYRLPSGHDEIGAIIQELEKAHIVHPTPALCGQ